MRSPLSCLLPLTRCTRLHTDLSCVAVISLSALLCSIAGCKELTGNPGLPAGTPNPSVYANASGAIGMRNATVAVLEDGIEHYITDSGLLTDELEDPETGASAGVLLSTIGIRDPLDERISQSTNGSNVGGGVSYNDLQQVRGFANQAIGALAAYDTAKADTATAPILRGELYAFEGYAEILLADLFCSGVPLSTLDFQGGYTYASGSTKEQVYHDAISKFDTALTVAHASDSVVHLAQVLKGRAYLALGNYPAAADDVTTVPDAFQYQVAVQWGGFTDGRGGAACDVSSIILACAGTVSNQEGENGLRYRLSGDPRTAVIGIAINDVTGDSVYFPSKYGAALTGTGFAPVTIASGVEARLIQAEAQLQPANAPHGAWLATLNQLRTNAVTNTGGRIPALPGTLSDPGVGLSATAAATARLALLFQERAFWLFLDGHRQGDLRRLLRQYPGSFSNQQKVYPTGVYRAPGLGTYGSDVTASIPAAESANPQFHGCKDRNP